MSDKGKYQAHKYDFCEKHEHDVNDNTGYRCWECDYETISMMIDERKSLKAKVKELEKDLVLVLQSPSYEETVSYRKALKRIILFGKLPMDANATGIWKRLLDMVDVATEALKEVEG